MALVDYSDSESDGENAPVPAPATKPQTQPAAAPKSAFQKAAPGKIQVSLPSVKPEVGQNGDAPPEGPPAKRARTGGAFSGFNALLPAPKKAAQSGSRLKKGVSLKTSGEAAFSRNSVPQTAEEDVEEGYTASVGQEQVTEKKEEPLAEPKLVGKATRFLPLSVSGKKKKKPVAKVASLENSKGETQGKSEAERALPQAVPKEPEPPKPKPKKSLFSVQAEEETILETSTGEYEPITIERHTETTSQQPSFTTETSHPNDPNSLQAVAADMNLTPAQRRQLFGRSGGKDANVMHFNLDAEYRNNEAARQAGEVVEHRAVKAIAPGKHSLQQLVNNARTQQDGLEDKWAEGRRNRGEGGSKYGWTS